MMKSTNFFVGMFVTSMLVVMFSININVAFAEQCMSAGVMGSCVPMVATCPSGTETATPLAPCSNNGVCCVPLVVNTNVPLRPTPTTTGNAVVDGAATNVNTAANASATTGDRVKFDNPLGTITSIDGLLGSILTAARNVVVILAIIAIVIGGIMYIFAGVNEGMVKSGKTAITYALVGVAVVVAAPAFLKEIIAILGGGSSGMLNTAPLSGALTLAQIGTNVLNFLLSIVGILGMIGLVLGGTFYLTAFANSKQAERGKEIATYSLIGITIALSAMILVKQIAALIEG